jgi:hypothetical protein
MDKRDGWLKNLKVGDKVVVERSRFPRGFDVLSVRRITPTGKIVVDDGSSGGCTYDHRGVRRADSWTWFTLSQWTPELQAKINHEGKVNVVMALVDMGKLSKVKLMERDNAQLDEILALLEPLKKDEGE